MNRKHDPKDSKDEESQVEKPFDFETFEIKTLEDFATWNMHAHKAFREAKKVNPKCDPPIPCRSPDESFHPKAKIKFQRFDQPENVLKLKIRSKEIDYTGQLKPGCTYELPLPVIRFLNRLSTPIFAEVKVEDGTSTKTETKQVGERSRFSCQMMDMV
jgi:hypothetical protein